ncbi:MAG TPA: hypothetical protein VG711_06810, partial [Phycisphaerales bacterium]|nr:hypothetical protein [Phycisphaerales bacterium]
TQLLWARYTNGEVEETQGQPRMQAREGELRFRNDLLELKGLKGLLKSTDSSEDITPVPYEVNLTIGPIGVMDWSNKDTLFAQMKEKLPFHAKFDVTDFRMQSKDDSGTAKVELPVQVANVFSRLMLRDWVLSCSVEVWRDAGEEGVDSIKRRGTAVVRDARLSYRKFPYLVENAEAYLEFDQNRVIVHRVNGKGSQGAEVTVSGEIAPPTADGAVNMRVTARNVPLDDRFRSALKDKNLEAYDSLFDAKALESMSAAGVFDGVQVDGLVKPNEPWGKIDFDLAVTREAGKGLPTTMSGKITVDNAMLMYTKFPYPVFVRSGWINWEKNQITLAGAEGKGWKVESIAGGQGWIGGTLDWLMDGENRRIQPHLNLEVEGDSMSPALLAAIPGTTNKQVETSAPEATPPQALPDAALSKPARILAGLHIQGSFGYAGTIDVGADGHPTYNVSLAVNEGSISPDAALADEIGLRGMAWPDGYSINSMTGNVRIGHDAIELKEITGKSGAEEIGVNGIITHSVQGLSTHLVLELKHHQLDPSVLTLVSQERYDQVREIWDRYHPMGLYAAKVHYASSESGGHNSTVEVEPELLELDVDGKDVVLQGDGGTLVMADGDVELNQLRIHLSTDGRPEGLIELNGSVAASGPTPQCDVSGSWIGGEFESPLVTEVLNAIGAKNDLQRVQSLNLAGGFDATFAYTTPRDGHAGVARFESHPKTIAADVNGTRVTMEIEKGEVDVSRERILIKDLSGMHAGGHLNIDGEIKTSGGLNGDLTINYDGRILSDSMQCFFPQQVKDMFSTIKFEERMSSRLRDGRLEFRESAKPDGSPDWSAKFTGTLGTQNASFVAGVPFTEIDGDLDIHVEREAGQAPVGQITAHATNLRVLGHTLTNVEAGLSLTDDGKLLEISNIRAQATGGRVVASAKVGLGDRKDYEASVELVAVSLEEFFEPPKDLVDTGTKPAGKVTDRPTGDVYGALSIAGFRDNPASRRGRGLVRVPNGELATVPLGLRLLQLLQMTLPMGSKLDSAAVDFFIDGDLVKFERIVMEKTSGNSASVTFTGEGVMDYSTLELNLRFRSRSGLLLVKEILGEVTDQLWEIEVTGPLSAPQARLVPLPGMRSDRNTWDNHMSAVADVHAPPN